jgi:glycosyltransferase involved in cell wall biosynthesis
VAVGESDPPQVLIVSLGSTEGLRRADEELRASLERAGASVALVSARRPRPVRTLMLTDLAWARAARAAAIEGLVRAGARDGGGPAIVYSSTTAALLWPRPGAIRFDASCAGNRPGRHGLWQRPLERRRLAQAPLLLPWSEGALREAPRAAREGGRALVLPVPVEPSGPLEPYERRDVAAITYAANPMKKGLDRVLEAWRAVHPRLPPEGPRELVVAGVSETELRRAGLDLAGAPGVRLTGPLAQQDYRALVRRARVFVCAPRREDYGIAQLEALADGCMLVTTSAPGPYAALPLAQALDARLVDEELAGALRVGLLEPREGYAQRAREALTAAARPAVDRLVAGELLARLVAPAVPQ